MFGQGMGPGVSCPAFLLSEPQMCAQHRPWDRTPVPVPGMARAATRLDAQSEGTVLSGMGLATGPEPGPWKDWAALGSAGGGEGGGARTEGWVPETHMPAGSGLAFSPHLTSHPGDRGTQGRDSKPGTKEQQSPMPQVALSPPPPVQGKAALGLPRCCATQPPAGYSCRDFFPGPSLLMSNHKPSCCVFVGFSLSPVHTRAWTGISFSLIAPPTAWSPPGSNSRSVEGPKDRRCLPHPAHPSSCNPREGGRKRDVTFRIPVMENPKRRRGPVIWGIQA